MPYKLMGKTILVQRNGKWVALKTHTSREKAMAHFRALKANVKK